MSNIKNIKNNLIFSVLSQLVTIAFGLLVPRLILVGYGSEINGVLSSAAQVIVYLSLFESGIYQVALKNLYGPVRNHSRTDINAILSAVNSNYKKIGFWYLFALVAISLVYPLIAKAEDLDYFSVLLIVLFSGLGNVVVFFVQGKYKLLLQADGKYYIIANTQTVLTILTNLFKIILLYIGVNVVLVIAIIFAVNLLQAIYILVYVKRHYDWLDLTVKPNYKALEQKNAMLVHTIAGLVFQNTDIIIVTTFCGLKSASVYAVYKLVVSQVTSLLNMVFSSFSYYLGQLYNTAKQTFIQAIDAVETFNAALVFAIYNVTLCLFIPFIKIYTDGVTDINYIDYGMAVLFVLVELLSLMRMPMVNTIHYAGEFRSTLWRAVLETVINITFSLAAVNFLGLVGVLWGTVFALLYRTVDIIIFANKRLLNRGAFKTFSIYVIQWILLILVNFLFNNLNVNIDSWFDFLICGVMLTPISLILHFGISALVFKKEFMFIKDTVCSKFLIKIQRK